MFTQRYGLLCIVELNRIWIVITHFQLIYHIKINEDDYEITPRFYAYKVETAFQEILFTIYFSR